MSQPPPIPSLPPPLLSPEQMRQIAAARAAGRRIQRAAIFATCDGWTLAALAALSLACGFTSVSGFALGVGLAVVATVELKAASRLRRLDPEAARLLGLNQLALAAMLILYAAWSIYAELSGRGLLAQLGALDPATADLLKDVEGLARQIALGVYGLVILVAIAVQGGSALFYFSRTRHIRAYLRGTPEWILQMQRSGVAL